jgi:hypothetical protein
MCGGNKRSCYSRGHYTFCEKHPNHIQAVRGYNRPCPGCEAEEKAEELKKASDQNMDALKQRAGNIVGAKRAGKKKGKGDDDAKKYVPWHHRF